MNIPVQWPRNRLLAVFRPEDFGRLESDFDHIALIPGDLLQDAGTHVEHVYFVESGALSVLAMTDHEATVEVGLVGHEGMFGIPAVLGAETTPHRCLVQAAGSALRISAADLRRVMDGNAELRRVLLRFVEAFMVQAAQAAACNARHTLSERLAKWLLMLQTGQRAIRFRSRTTSCRACWAYAARA